MINTKQASRLFSFLLCLALTASLSLSVGCSSAKKDGEDMSESSIGDSVGADENSGMDSDSGKAMGLQTVLFPYDSFTLDETGKATLKGNAEILKSNSAVKVQIEGHCDSRGGTQYNIALGEKRASAAKAFLQDLGVASSRITTISFGKEKLLVTGDTEAAHAKNRRGNFVITSK